MAIMRRRWCGAAVLCALCLASTGAAAQDEGGDAEAAGEASAEASAEGSLELGGGLDPEAGLGSDDAESGMGDEDAGMPSTGPVLDGALRLGLDLLVLQLDMPSRDELSVNAMGTETPTGTISETNFSFGIQNSALGATAGYGLTPNLQLGLRLALGIGTGSGENDPEGPAAPTEADRSNFNLRLAPFVEYIFDVPSPETRLFARASIGFQVTSVTTTFTQSSGESETSESGTLFAPGIGGGLHMFVTDDLSFDPMLIVSYGIGSQTIEQSGVAMTETKYDFTALNISLFAGLSGWLEL